MEAVSIIYLRCTEYIFIKLFWFAKLCLEPNTVSDLSIYTTRLLSAPKTIPQTTY